MAQASSSNLTTWILKKQFLVLASLATFIILPYVLIRIFLPSIPHMQYYFVGILFVIKILVMEDGKYSRYIQKSLPSIIGSNSKDKIFKTTKFMVATRNTLLALTVILILILHATI